MKRLGSRLLASAVLLGAASSCMPGRYMGETHGYVVEGIVQGDTLLVCGRTVEIADATHMVGLITRCAFSGIARGNLDGVRIPPGQLRPGEVIVQFELVSLPTIGVGPKPWPPPPQVDWTRTALDAMRLRLQVNGIRIVGVRSGP